MTPDKNSYWDGTLIYFLWNSWYARKKNVISLARCTMFFCFENGTSDCLVVSLRYVYYTSFAIQRNQVVSLQNWTLNFGRKRQAYRDLSIESVTSLAQNIEKCSMPNLLLHSLRLDFGIKLIPNWPELILVIVVDSKWFAVSCWNIVMNLSAFSGSPDGSS